MSRYWRFVSVCKESMSVNLRQMSQDIERRCTYLFDFALSVCRERGKREIWNIALSDLIEVLKVRFVSISAYMSRTWRLGKKVSRLTIRVRPRCLRSSWRIDSQWAWGSSVSKWRAISRRTVGRLIIGSKCKRESRAWMVSASKSARAWSWLVSNSVALLRESVVESCTDCFPVKI